MLKTINAHKKSNFLGFMNYLSSETIYFLAFVEHDLGSHAMSWTRGWLVRLLLILKFLLKCSEYFFW
jgi:hypothetical protein